MGRLFPITALAMVFSMMPGALELSENLMHLAVHQDAAHGDNHGDDEPGDEHGCSGPYHICSCHHSMTFVSASAQRPPVSVEPRSSAATARVAEAIDAGFIAELDRPPQA